MSTPGQEPQTPKGSFGEIAPGVPRYGQYAPEGYQPPSPVQPLPAAQQPSPQPGPAPLAPPRQVMLAFTLLLIAAAINTVVTVLAGAVLLTAAGRSTAVAMMVQMGVEDTSLVEPALIVSVVLGFVSIALYAVIAFALRRGRNWARITGAILAAISLLSLIVPNVITVIQVALGLAAMLIVFRQPAAAWFRKR